MPYSWYEDERENCRCNYDEMDQLRHFGDFLIEDLNYYDFARHFGTADCVMEPATQNDEPHGIDVVGEVLGWHAGKVDDEKEDAIFALKFTNSIFIDYIQKGADAAWKVPFMTIFAPIYCLVKWFSGDECSLKEAYQELSELDPVEHFEGLLPGVGEIMPENIPAVGLWHMLDVDRQNKGRYNNIPGTLIAYAGPNEMLGVLDIAALASADLLGITVRAKDRASKGVERYAQFDEKRRPLNAWQRENMAHTEFSPVSNLAEWGWREFVKSPTTAKYLGWPLHAFGDMVVPHHIVATLSWGHQPFEDAMAWMSEEGKFEDKEEDILHRGYYWWEKYCQNLTVDVKGMVEEVALNNRDRIDDWAWNDRASTLYRGGTKDEQDSAIEEYYFMGNTGDSTQFKKVMAPIWAEANAAALALMVCAAGYVKSEPSEFVRCPSGKHFDVPSLMCVDGEPQCEETENDTDISPVSEPEGADSEDSDTDTDIFPII